jgi:PAS domain S-box-containing protein
MKHTTSITKRKLRNIIDGVFTMLAITNLKGEIMEANKSFANLMPDKWDLLIGKNIFDVFPFNSTEESRNKLINIFAQIEKRQSITYEDKIYYDGDKSFLIFEINLVLIDKEVGEQSKHVVITIEDITSKKLYQEELESQKSEFLSIASHELKTPMTILNGYLEILNKKILSKDASYKNFKDLIEIQMEKLNLLVNELHDLSRMDLNKLKLNKKKSDISKLIQNTVKKLSPFLDNHFINMDLENDVEKVKIDEDRIEQVITNLLINSVEHSDAAGEIQIRLMKTPNNVRVEVQDHGMGIPPDKIGRLFEKFYQVEDKGELKNGLGLGLYISAEIIKAHSGKLGVTSKYGNGSTFYFTLPIS